MKAYVTMTFEVQLPKDLEYLKDVDWGDEDIGLTLTGPVFNSPEDGAPTYEEVKLTLSRHQETLYDLEILQPTIEEVIVDD